MNDIQPIFTDPSDSLLPVNASGAQKRNNGGFVPDEDYINYGKSKGDCGRIYTTAETVRGPCEPAAEPACCPKKIPTGEDWEKFRELMLKQCRGETLTECERNDLRVLRYKFGSMVWGFNPTSWTFEAGRVLNRSQLKDNSVNFGTAVFGSFFFFLILTWSIAGFATTEPDLLDTALTPDINPAPANNAEIIQNSINTATTALQNSGNAAANALATAQFARDLLSTHFWAYVGAIFATTFASHLLFVTAYVEGLSAVMLWFFSNDGPLTSNKPRFSPILVRLAGQAAGFALAGGLTLAVWSDKSVFDSLKFEPATGFSQFIAYLFENTGAFIIAIGWISALVVPRTLIKQFHSFQVVVPVLVTLFHGVAKALTLYVTGGALGLWTYLFVSLFLTGFGSAVWVFIVAPITGALIAGLFWFIVTRSIFGFGGNKLGKLVFRSEF